MTRPDAAAALLCTSLMFGVAMFSTPSAAQSAPSVKDPAVSSFSGRSEPRGEARRTSPSSKRADPKQSQAAKSTSPRPARPASFEGAEQLLHWIQTYRTRPEPQRLSIAFKTMSRLGMFREMEQAGLQIGFTAGVLGVMGTEDPVAAIGRPFPLPPEDQPALLKAIAMSRDAQWKPILRALAERMPSRAALIDRYVRDQLPALAALPMDAGPQPLDIMWGRYFATGTYEPLLRIISILDWAKETNDLERLTIGSMAKFTLAQNASRDLDLLRHLRSSVAHEGGRTRELLLEVIAAAEAAETATIRKEALAAIDQLKLRGPERARNMQWWGRAGQTALALGCIVASATGNVGLGLPCVVGGALSGAAINALSSQ